MPLGREERFKHLKKRLQAIVRLSVAGFLLLILGFAFNLQIIKGNYYYEASKRNKTRYYRTFARRGDILDREGNKLATDVPSFDLYIIPHYFFKGFRGRIEDHPTFRFIVRRLKVDPEDLIKRLRRARRSPFDQLLIKRNLTDSEVALIKSMEWMLPGIYIDSSWIRTYPYGSLFAHVVGYVGEATEKQVASGKRYSGELVGKTGLELEYDDELRGTGGWEEWEVDARGHRIRMLNRSLPERGRDLITTLLLPLQKRCAELFKGKTGAVVALDPNTGEVLAMYSSPSYDPNLFPRGIPYRKWLRILKNPEHPLTNRAIAGLYPPGSTFKLVVATAGLTEGKITTKSKVFCPGGMKFGNRFYRCWKRAGHGWVDVHKAIVESCDTFFYDLGLKLGNDFISKYAFMFGLGKRTGVDLPGEKGGVVPTRRWKRRVLHQPWYPGETLSYAIGQGYLLVTPLQLAVMASAFANGGYVVKPHLNRYARPPKKRLPVPRWVIRTVRRAMLGVVEEKKGTAHWTARIKGVKVAGKTGTAQVVSSKVEEKYKKGKKITVKRYMEHAWFVAFAPFERPVIAVAVVVEHGGHGSSAAAPIAREVIKEYLKYRGLL